MDTIIKITGNMRIIVISILLVSLIASTAPAQWDWVKAVGVSGWTDWDAVSMDETGNFYFSGFTDKLAGSPPRAYVTAKYNQTGAAQWNTKLLTVSGVNGASNGVDASGNSYMIQGVLGGQKIKLPDGSEFSHFLNYHFISKYNADGSLAWAKKLTVPNYAKFQVMPDGTVCILAENIQYYFLFGNDSIETGPAYSGYFLEIKTDGTIGRAVMTGNITGFSPKFVQWKEPGKLFVINSLSIYFPLFQSGTIDLETKTLTYESDTLVVNGGGPGLLNWNNTGLPNAQTTVVDPKNGHIFALMSCNSADFYLNDKDTLYAKTNNQTEEGYVVEFDDQLNVVRKIRLTNALQLAVVDSFVVVTAIVRATNGFGFQSPDITVNITKTSNNQDGYVLYVMDRNFKYVRHGLVEGQIQKLFSPYATLVRPNGEVFISLSADGDLYFQSMPPFGSHSGTVLAKLSGGGSSDVRSTTTNEQSSVYPNPTNGLCSIEQPGAFHYIVTDLLGNKVTSGEGTNTTVCDLSQTPCGTYFVVIETTNGREVRMIKKTF